MRIGIVGVGPMGRSHARAVRDMKFVQEILTCDLSKKARQAAAKEGFRTVADLKDLVAWKPDAAIVAMACDQLVMQPKAVLGGPGAYQIPNLPGSNYYLKAWMDSNADGTKRRARF